jgi:hypothetical protein
MAITTFARIQHRRGIKTDLPQELYEGELGWCIDTRELFIGNGQPFGGNTQILTSYSPNNDLITNFWRTKDLAIVASVARPLGAKLNDFASVKDFGATGNGSTNDAPAINAAIQELFTSLGNLAVIDQARQITLYLPAGTYAIEASILLYPYLNLVGDGVDNTVVLVNDASLLCAMETADSQGNTGGNIGTSGATLPKNISVRNLTVSTNGNKIDCVLLNRYQKITFDNVRFVGPYVPADSGLFPYSSVRLQNLSPVAIEVERASFLHCEFSYCTYGIYADEDVRFTTVVDCSFNNLWRGVCMGSLAVNGGPAHTTVTASSFSDIDNIAVFYDGTNFGLASTGNRFSNCGISEGTRAVVFGNPSVNCASIGDNFDVAQGVADYGVGNILHNGSQTNVGTAASRNISFTKIFAPGVSEILFYDVMSVSVEFQISLAGSSVRSLTGPAAPYTLTFRRNGTPFATADFAAAGTVATLTCAAAETFLPGDVFDVIAPNPDDPNITGITVDLTALTF